MTGPEDGGWGNRWWLGQRTGNGRFRGLLGVMVR